MAPPKHIMIKTVLVHQPIMWPGMAGADSKTISDKKIMGLKMRWAPHGLVLTAKGETCIVPHANVACAVVDGSDDVE